MVILSAEQVISNDLLSDTWARDRLYNIDYTHHDNTRLALYPVNDLSQKMLNDALEQHQSFLFDGEI